jgi:hypothetical protein
MTPIEKYFTDLSAQLKEKNKELEKMAASNPKFKEMLDTSNLMIQVIDKTVTPEPVNKMKVVQHKTYFDFLAHKAKEIHG